MTVPVFSRAAVLEAVTPQDAYGAVRNAFLAHHSGEWAMPPKVYVTNYPAGDFRAMPAIGGGHALLKWVTSFPGNPALGLPTVTGLVILSNVETGQLEAVLEAAAVARGHTPLVWDVDENRRRIVAEELGVPVAGSLAEALASDVVVTVTPGREVLYPEGSLRPGQHVSLIGADGPGKAEIAAAELGRARLFCDDWEQASHGGELAAGVEAGTVARDDVTQLGAVLAGEADGRRSDEEITLFDSTGLAIQDLAIARAALLKSVEMDLPRLEL
jgi:ornithine cyclodeaminase/alanine dehydrogenase-like protein (mu-crystallin family)